MRNGYHHGTMAGGDCCLGCTKRHVGCHNIETCPEWAEAEKRKAADRAKRLEESRRREMICDIVERGQKRNKRKIREQ